MIDDRWLARIWYVAAVLIQNGWPRLGRFVHDVGLRRNHRLINKGLT